MHAYCLFCRTQRCADIAALLQKTTDCRCISPRIIQRKWIHGKAFDVPHDWLPGYLFIYTERSVLPRPSIDGVIRVLGGGELTGSDRDFADMLYRRDGTLGTVRLAEVGDRCHIADPLWESLQGTIIKVDRGRKRCCIEYEFDDTRRTIWVGYDLVKADIVMEESPAKQASEEKIPTCP